MPVISVRIPQIGEGLQEARLVAVLKQPGEYVKRDEPIYQMETDKAVMDVESPYEGTLVEWLGQPDDILAIGAEVARMEVANAVEEAPVHGAHVTSAPAQSEPVAATVSSARNANVPPRTRAYAKEKGIGDDQLATIPSAGGKLMPTDIDAFLAGGAGAGTSNDRYSEQAVPQKQRLLASRLVRGAQLVVPGTMTVVTQWEAIEHARARLKAGGGEFQPSSFTMFAYAVTQALKRFPAFRSTLVGEDKLRTYNHVSLGIAVSLPGDELVLAVVEDADTLDWRTFAQRTRERIDLARSGKDQANEAMTISLTNMQSFGLRDAVPVVVPPAVATLFLGETFFDLDPSSETPKLRRVANMALTFDHRVLNGVGAAEFMKAVKQNVETIGSLID
jgi:pyruvate dehydrogenase E2 component (dihydrolipoamide acetyltransferase)